MLSLASLGGSTITRGRTAGSKWPAFKNDGRGIWEPGAPGRVGYVLYLFRIQAALSVFETTARPCFTLACSCLSDIVSEAFSIHQGASSDQKDSSRAEAFGWGHRVTRAVIRRGGFGAG